MDNPIVKKERFRGTPELDGKRRFIKFLEARGWECHYFGATSYSTGWPDNLFCNERLKCHKWVEAKTPGKKLTSSQVKKFRSLANCGIQIHVIEVTPDMDDRRMHKIMMSLFESANWMMYIPGL